MKETNRPENEICLSVCVAYKKLNWDGNQMNKGKKIKGKIENENRLFSRINLMIAYINMIYGQLLN